MEEAASGGREPGLRCAEQTELLSLIISGEEEATRERREEDGLANGHGGEESGADTVTQVNSPCTSYWSITEGPDQPLLLSPAPGPPGPPGRKPRVQRASRPGLSRIPGRDHRRYYHEYWRSEYLMDFDPQRHGMICMVCGSSLATLKLSTIKRHIRQKHPDSLLWSAADKEVIRSGWESHLSLGAGRRAYADGALPQVKEEQLDPGQPTAAEGLAPEPQGEEPQHPLLLSPDLEEEEDRISPPQKQEEADLSGPSTRTLERYLNDSLHAWFRQEFLMEYEAEAGRLSCMVCGGELPSLHLDHIKSHVLDTHPNSLVYSSQEKHCILQAWAQTHEDSENSIKSEPSTKDSSMDLFAPEAQATPINTDLYPESDSTLTQDTCLIGEDGGPQRGARPHRRPRKRRPPGASPWRLRLDYLVAYGPRGQDTFCMVCSQVLRQNKVSSFRRHIKENHPETTALSPQEREAMAAAWTKDYSSDDAHSRDEIPLQDEIHHHDDTGASTPKRAKKEDKTSKAKDGDGSSSSSSSSTSSSTTPTSTPTPTPGAARHSHYPGKDQKRNYQVRWRLDYLMDYDCRRHGLICMVCGATLATLKVSTIKRHIQQVHPLSLVYSPQEKQQALLTYDQSALHLGHAHDCFSSQEHGHGRPEPCADPGAPSEPGPRNSSSGGPTGPLAAPLPGGGPLSPPPTASPAAPLAARL